MQVGESRHCGKALAQKCHNRHRDEDARKPKSGIPPLGTGEYQITMQLVELGGVGRNVLQEKRPNLDFLFGIGFHRCRQRIDDLLLFFHIMNALRFRLTTGSLLLRSILGLLRYAR